MSANKREDSPGDTVEIENYQTTPEVEHENGAVLLDIGASDAKSGATGLKLSPNGHVSITSLRGVLCC